MPCFQRKGSAWYYRAHHKRFNSHSSFYLGLTIYCLVILVFHSCPCIKVNGTYYKEGFLVIRGVHKDLPSFGRIKQIICFNGREIFFFLEPFRAIGLDGHLHAYSVESDHTTANALTLQGEAYVILRRRVQAWMD